MFKLLKQNVNICNIFIIAYCGRVAIAAKEANSISALLLGVVLLISVACFLYANIYYRLPKYMKALNFFIYMLVIYGVLHIMFDGVAIDISGVVVNKKLYLQTALESLLPIYAFYVFTRKGYLTLNNIKFLLPFFVLLCIYEFNNLYQNRLMMAMMSGSSQNEFTNNTGYHFVSLFPLLALSFKKKWLQYLLWGICLIYILLAVKRGAIIIAAISTVFFLWETMKYASAKSKGKIIALSLVLILVGLFTLQKQLENSDYFKSRIESTKQGDMNGREQVYGPLIDNIIYKTTAIETIIGQGANSTIRTTGFRAHNDWLQILSDQGIIGVIIYLWYFLCLYKLWKENKSDSVVGITLGLFLIINFFRTFFSMSYADYSMYASMAIGYSVAYLDNKQRNINYENSDSL